MVRRLLLLSVGLSLLLAPEAGAFYTEHPREVQAAELVSGAEGWAQTGRGLYWTADGGTHWRSITPPVEHPEHLGSVYFATPERGWAMSEEGREGANRDAFFGTRDGGATWARERVEVDGLGTIAGGAYFSQAGRELVYAMVQEARNTAYSIGYLFRSRDGGVHWTQLPNSPPHAGKITFTDSRHGWLAGGGPHPAFYRTRDGGRTWTEVALPRPPGERGGTADFLAPRFEPDGHGVLAATYYQEGFGTDAVLYTTRDDGIHWKLASVSGPEAEGTSLLSYRGGDSVVGFDYPGPGLTVFTVGAAPTQLAATGLPPESFPTITFSGAEDGFALENPQECGAYGRCKQPNRLLFSSDGGRSWAPTTRP